MNDLRYIALVYKKDKETPNPSIVFVGSAFFRHELDYQIQWDIYKLMRSHLLTQVIHFKQLCASLFHVRDSLQSVEAVHTFAAILQLLYNSLKV